MSHFFVSRDAFRTKVKNAAIGTLVMNRGKKNSTGCRSKTKLYSQYSAIIRESFYESILEVLFNNGEA